MNHPINHDDSHMDSHMNERPASGGGPDPLPELDPKIQSAIGNALQAHFHDLVTAPMPDRFLVLLAELEAKELANGH